MLILPARVFFQPMQPKKGVSMVKKTIGLILGWCGLLILAPAYAQNAYAPPRNVEDIFALLDQYETKPAIDQNALRSRAAQQPPDTGDKATIARLYLNRAQAKNLLGLRAGYVADLNLALAHAPERTNLFLGIRSRLADAESTSGSLQRALQIYQEIAQTTPRANIGLRMEAHSRLSDIYRAFGDYAAARAELVKMEQAFEDRKTDPVSALYEHERLSMREHARANQYTSEGKLVEAEQAHKNALREIDLDAPFARQRLAEKRFARSLTLIASIRGQYSINLAMVLRQRGKLVEAEGVLREQLAKDITQFGRYHTRIGFILRELARTLNQQGRSREAELIARAAIDAFQKSETEDLSRNVIIARRVLAASLNAQGEWPRALVEYDAIAERVRDDPFMAARYPLGDIGWGMALVRNGQASRAVPMLDGLTKTLSGRLGDLADDTAQMRGILAWALAANGERDRALTEFGRAIPVLLSFTSGDGDDENGGVIRARRLRVILEGYIDLLTAGEQRSSTDAIADSFRVADAARASSVQRALSESVARASITDPALAGLVRDEQDVRVRLGTLTGLLGRLLGAPVEEQLPKVIAGIRTEIDNLRAQRTKLKLTIEKRFPDYANLVDPKPVTLQQARAALKAGEALISLYVGQNKTYVWAIPQQGAPAFAVVPLGDKALGVSVTELRKALDIGDTAIARFPRFDTAVAHRLFNDLLKPVEAGWKDANSLIIVPHRALGQLPFSLLVTAPAEIAADAAARFDGYRAVPWLLRKAAVTQLPSVNALSTLRGMPAVTANRREFIGFGDPYFSKTQQAEAASQERIQVAALSPNLRNLRIDTIAQPMANDSNDSSDSTLRNAPKVANSSTLAQLARLPETADEIRDIAQALKADPKADVFLGLQANEKNVKSMNLANRKVIAFATHGLIPGDLNGLEQPALALTAPDVAGIDGDGLLTMEEILALKLNADWVVLSACNTGTGDGAGSEAISGLGRAFFYAGARSLLVSNWPVETLSARLLTADIFKRSAENPALIRAEALRQTMLWLMDNAGQRDVSGRMEFTYAHPMFWAPFVLIGDGGR
jgi:CHAT domain-containing protein